MLDAMDGILHIGWWLFVSKVSREKLRCRSNDDNNHGVGKKYIVVFIFKTKNSFLMKAMTVPRPPLCPELS